MQSDVPDAVAKIDGDVAAKVTKPEQHDIYVWRRDDGQLFKWSRLRKRSGPKETNTGIMNTLNEPRYDVEYVDVSEVPCLDEDGVVKPHLSGEVDRSSLSREQFKELLTFDGSVQGYPTTHALVVRDSPELLIYASRSKNADSEWEVRRYRILGDGISFSVEDPDRANVAAVLIEVFGPDALRTDRRHLNQSPVRYGVPVAIAVDGKPAIAAWLYVRGEERSEIAETMDVGERTVSEYLSRFRGRGPGVPDHKDLPDVGDVVEEIPREFDPIPQRIVADGGDRCVE